MLNYSVAELRFYSFYQNNAIGFNCLRSRFHISSLFYSKFSIGVLSYKTNVGEKLSRESFFQKNFAN